MGNRFFGLTIFGLLTAFVAGLGLHGATSAAPRLTPATVTQSANLDGVAFDYINTNNLGVSVESDVGPSTLGYPGAPVGLVGDYLGTTTLSAGVLGVSTAGYGVAGEVFGGTAAAVVGNSYTIGPAVLANAGTGNAIVAMATAADAITGTSAFNGVNGSTSAVSGQHAGVLGQDTTTTATGNYGVLGQTTASYGVYGLASGSGYGGYFNSSVGTAVYGYTQSATGGIGILGAATGEGGIFYGYSGTTIDPVLTAISERPGTDLFATYGAFSSINPETFIVQAATANRSGKASINGSDVQVSGDLYVSGRVFTDCTAFPAKSTTTCGGGSDVATQPLTSGGTVGTFSPKQGHASIEDFGEAELVNGIAIVRLDPTIAAAIEPGSGYLVFITPDGDSRGLYVAQKGSEGFIVREQQSGHSTLQFDYRIVAKPYVRSSPISVSFQASQKLIVIGRGRALLPNKPSFHRMARSGTVLKANADPFASLAKHLNKH